jgi:hypothetical protein
MQLYAAEKVVDAVEKMTGGQINWINRQPKSAPLNNIQDSPTYQFVQETEGKRPPPPAPGCHQSSTVKMLETACGHRQNAGPKQ